MIRINKINTKNITLAFEKYGDAAVKEVSDITSIVAQEIEAEAKNVAQQKHIWDKGDLVQNIRAEQFGSPLHYKITSYMPYSAYHEFGTGGMVRINEDWGAMAAQFKGAGIKEVNLPARPFMYPAFVKGRTMFNKAIKDALKDLNKKFNG